MTVPMADGPHSGGVRWPEMPLTSSGGSGRAKEPFCDSRKPRTSARLSSEPASNAKGNASAGENRTRCAKGRSRNHDTLR